MDIKSTSVGLQHVDDFAKFIGQLTRQLFAKRAGKAAVVPKGPLFRLAESGPYCLPHVGLPQVAKDGAGVMDFVGQGHAEQVVVTAPQMDEIGFLPVLPARLALPSCRVGEAVRATLDDPGDALAEPVANVLQPGLATLILDAVVQKCRDG